MSAVAVEPRTAPVSREKEVANQSGWLFGPWFDLLLVANVAWPLLLLVPIGEGFDGRAGVQFWQVYFVTTPHRWITLALVFLDRDRFGERRGTFLAVAGVIAALCLGVRMTTGTLTCLLAVDYIWNAWHFAAQHHGVYRIYGRLTEPQRARGLALERWTMRLFLLYVTFRVAGTTWSNAPLEGWLSTCDWFVIALPAGLIIGDAVRGLAPGRLTYLLSVSTLYLSLLWAVQTRKPGLILALATASALFHAIEYLSLVGWSVRQRHSKRGSRMGLLGWLAPRWGITIGMFVLILGSSAWLMDQHLLRTWLLVNVIVAFLHYAYDGMIWRQRPAGAGSRGA